MSLGPRTVTDEVIADYARIAKSKDFMASLGVTNLVSEVMPPHIANDL